jgi:hydroxymethylpyrimidine pyrophosphatase-like HAD family hydrolase
LFCDDSASPEVEDDDSSINGEENTIAATITTTTTASSSSSSSSSSSLWNNETFSTTSTTAAPRNSSSSSSKADLYTNEELMNLLQVHQSIVGVTNTLLDKDESNRNNPISTSTSSSSWSLHDLIVQTLQQEDDDTVSTTSRTNTTTSTTTTTKTSMESSPMESPIFHTTWTKEELIYKVQKIRAIISDVDGTLLGPTHHTVHPMTELAIHHVMKEILYASESSTSSPPQPSSSSLQHFFVATGKTRIGAMQSLGPRIASLLQNCPGVYVQGLYCLDEKGKVLFEKKLSSTTIAHVETFITQLLESTYQNITVLAYDGDHIYYNPNQSHVQEHLLDVHEKWGEPKPIPLDAGMTFSTYPPLFHKLLIMGNDPILISQTIRPQLEESLSMSSSSLSSSSKSESESSGVVTQAIPTMLEVLPGGCSKAYGVRQICDHYGIDVSTQLCTMGDAENDYEMIQMASIGIAMGNAIPILKDVADIVMESTSDDGAAGQAMEWFGLKKILDEEKY